LTGRIRLTPLAQADIDDASAWYARQGGNALALAFQAAVDETLTRIAEFPEHAPLALRDARRRNVRIYPFGVWFVIEPAGPLAIAVLHHRQDPSILRARQMLP